VFCSRCKSECRDGIIGCPDCNLPLVGSLVTVQQPDQPAGPAIVWRGNNPIDFAFQPRYGIFLRQDDLAQVKKVIGEAFATKLSE
jgi:hypothetical protein